MSLLNVEKQLLFVSSKAKQYKVLQLIFTSMDLIIIIRFVVKNGFRNCQTEQFCIKGQHWDSYNMRANDHDDSIFVCG